MKYKVLVIDPPWQLAMCNPVNCTHGGIAKELPYQTMTDCEIENFDIEQFADAECDLFLWTTKAKIHTAFHILEKWGFRYANFLVWNKLDGLNHNGVHTTLEFVLYAYRGRNGLNYSKPIEAYFEEKRRKHSQKPDRFYSMIAKVTPEPRLDIFARKRHYGFEAWGNQVETQIEVPIMLFNMSEKYGENKQ
jgi:N6-adenosine-specific RNA methylase IME4